MHDYPEQAASAVFQMDCDLASFAASLPGHLLNPSLTRFDEPTLITSFKSESLEVAKAVI